MCHTPPVYSGGKITWSAELDSGCYDAVFSFYSTADSSSADGVLLYEFRESVHVCKSLVTDSWFGSSAYITTDGKCVITKALVDKFALSRIYVSSRKEDSKETGTRAEPYKSVARAMNALLDSGTDYTILVDGTLEGAQKIPVTLRKDGSGAYKAKTLSIKGAGAGAKINGNKEGTALTIETDVPVTIENITITGGETAGNGGGIYLASASSVTISENTEIISNDAKDGGGIFNAGTLYLCGGVISKNTASNCGGGVYSTGTLFMYGSAVIGDSSKTTAATKDESCYSNKATVKGGGICSTGNLYLGFSSADTEAVLTGGVYYNYAKNSGGIHQQDTSHSNKVFKFSSGSVSYNAERGMYVGYGKFTMTGGTVSGNTALQPEEENEDSFRGGGIYVGADCTALISGGKITSNEAAVKGGGIFIAQSSSKLTIEGGTISGNTAGSYGSGISMDNGSLKMQGGAKIDSSNDVYLPSGKVITITGELTGEAPIATITPAAWKRGTTIVQVDGETVTDATDFAGCFAVTQDGWDKCISGDKKSIYITAPIYVAPNGDDGESTPGTRANPFKTIKRGVKELLNAVGGEYTILVDGKLVEVQEIPSDLTKSMADSLTIKGTSGTSMIDANNNGSALTISTEVPVKIVNFTIKNGKTDSKGGGIYIDEKKADVTLGDGTVSGGVLITANEAQEGGGIYNKGKLTIKYGVNITSNSAKDGSHSQGGGVCNEGTFVMEDGAISSNCTEVTTDGYGGGGIANISAASSVYILGGAIARNSTTKYGGGLLNYQGKIFVSGNATIGGSGTDKNTADDRGGGIYSEGGYCYLGYDKANSEKEWTGKIAGNTAVKGGGIYSSSAVVTMNSGSIESNAASEKGGAVYEGDASQLKMGGKASILPDNEQKNDVYLEHEKTITVSGSLESENLAALITLPDDEYKTGTQVLAGDAVSSEYYKFYVRNINEAEEHLFVLDDGKLAPIFTFPNGTPCGTQTNPDDSLEYNAIKYSFVDADNLRMNIPNAYKENDYVTIEVDGEAPETAEIQISETESETINILGDGYHTVTVTLTNYASEPIVIEKRMYVRIKPIKLNYRNNKLGQLGNQWVCMSGFQAGTGRMDIRGRVELFSSPGSSSNSIIFDYQNSNYEIAIEQWYQLDWDSDGRYWETTLSSKDDYVWIVFNLWRNASTGMGSHTCPGRTLAQMKKVVVDKCGSNTQDNLLQWWTCWSGNQTNGSGQTAAVMVNFNIEERD